MDPNIGFSTASAPAWPGNFYNGTAQLGVIKQIISIPNSIGYIDLAEALDKSIPYATVINKLGQFIVPGVKSLQQALSKTTDFGA